MSGPAANPTVVPTGGGRRLFARSFRGMLAVAFFGGLAVARAPHSGHAPSANELLMYQLVWVVFIFALTTIVEGSRILRRVRIDQSGVRFEYLLWRPAARWGNLRPTG